jgi:serine/threonine protein kinase
VASVCAVTRGFAHVRQGIANRDLKLENLLLDRDGSDGTRPLLKICDFGYSKARSNLCSACATIFPLWHLGFLP